MLSFKMNEVVKMTDNVSSFSLITYMVTNYTHLRSSKGRTVFAILKLELCILFTIIRVYIHMALIIRVWSNVPYYPEHVYNGITKLTNRTL